MNKKTKKTETEIKLEVQEVKKEKEIIIWEEHKEFLPWSQIRRGLVDPNLESYFKLFEDIIYDFNNFLLKETPLTKSQEELQKAFKSFEKRVYQLDKTDKTDKTYYNFAENLIVDTDMPPGDMTPGYLLSRIEKEIKGKEFVSINFYLKDKKNEELLIYLIEDLILNETKKIEDRLLKIDEFKKQLEVWRRINLKY